MKRFKWMAYIVIASFFIAIPGYGLQLKIATLSPEGSAWMQKMQAGADEIHRKTNKRVRFKFFGGGIMGNDDAVLRKIRIGQLHGGAVTAGSLSHLYGDSLLYGLLMRFQSLQEIDRVRKKMDPMLMEGFEKNGIQFVQPTPEAQAEWRAAGMEVTQKLLEKGLISRQALDQLDSLLKTSGS